MKKTTTLLILCALFFTSCQSTQNNTNAKPLITTSFYPLYFIANSIGGEETEIINIIPQGKEPHSYQPSIKQIATIEKSNLSIIQGSKFEPWAKGIKAKSLLEITANIPVKKINNKKDQIDPHTWLDPILMIKETKLIRDKMIKTAPQYKEKYKKNAKNLIKSLESLHNSYKTELSNCKQRSFITSHDAFNYMADQYNLKSIAISGISPFDKPSAKQITELINLAKKENIKFIFFETLASPETAEMLAKEAHLTSLVLNPISDQDYITMMKENLKNLKTGLQCK